MNMTSSGALAERKDTFQYVPLLEGLRALLQNAEVCDEVGSA